jgi:uncharacterized protein YqjF (DUF2071 family)
MLRAIAQRSPRGRRRSKRVVEPSFEGTLGKERAGVCPHALRRAFMDQEWVNLSFLHWRYQPDAVQRLLPSGLRVDTFDGTAWVALVPFLLRVRIPRGPALPWIGVFPETNVRTYVRGPDGHSGIWFFSLEAPRRLAISAARRLYHLPYCVAALETHCDAANRTYASWRLGSPRRGASSRARVLVGRPVEPDSVTPLEHFLTARWRLYAPLRGGIGAARVEHAPWQLSRATAEDVDANLLVAAGLPYPDGDPIVHACEDEHASLTRLVPCRRPAVTDGGGDDA